MNIDGEQLTRTFNKLTSLKKLKRTSDKFWTKLNWICFDGNPNARLTRHGKHPQRSIRFTESKINHLVVYNK